jgi:small neutral amino acid transporter SnatA (MarC family)
MAAVNIYLKIFIALYILVNPFEGLPVFLARTETLSRRESIAIGHTAALVSSALCW